VLRVLLATTERMIYSAGNYWVALFSDLAGAIGLFIIGLQHHSSSMIASGASVAGGFLVWGCFEYSVHRWLLHGPPSMARRGHARHHADDTALISTPAFSILLIAYGIAALLTRVVPIDVACFLVFGVYAGYNHYALLHHYHHRRAAAAECVDGLGGFHRAHHERQSVNFGITTTFWDRLFGTYQLPENRSAARVLKYSIDERAIPEGGRARRPR
jgi:sterol desaturase/sphingolipid hydroxylase (fatty acid hydroxylase superfamily)